MKRYLILLLLAGVFLGYRAYKNGTLDLSGVFGSGERMTHVDSLEVGDCFQTAEEESIDEVAVVDCAQYHDNEVFLTYDLDMERNPVRFPGQEEVYEAANEGCLAGFEAYVGEPYESSRYYLGSISPSETTWNENHDRKVICYVHLPDGLRTEGSARGIGTGGVRESGQDEGTLYVGSLDEGDCFQENTVVPETEGSSMGSIPTVDCAGNHRYEVYHVFNLEGDSFPGPGTVDDAADTGCLRAFEGYVGSSYTDSRYYYGYTFPTPDTWNERNHREVTCYLYLPDAETWEGTARGSGA